jgi:hypothetical protein
MRSSKFYLFILLLLPVFGYAQYNLPENNIWTYSAGYGLNFNSGSPVPFTVPLRSLGGSATVADASGNLLFYTQGDTIWNKNNQVMPNGQGLIAPYTSNIGGSQSEQGQLIIPVIGMPGQYYVFSMQTNADFLFGIDPFATRLFYSVVDMSLNNGLGDVVAGKKGIMIDSMLTSSKLIAVAGDSCNIWVVAHNDFDNGFKSYSVTAAGIDTTPVVSVAGNLSGGIAYVEGKMRISPDRTKLAVASAFGSSLQEVGLDLFDFDPATGVVSNPILLDTNAINYSACFSPDNSKLYVLGTDKLFTSFILFQYDLSLPTTAAIIASKTALDTSNTFNYVKDIRLAPNGKIYIAMHEPANYLSVINNPNLAGTACGYVDSAVNMNMLTPSLGNTCFPNEYVTWIVDTVLTAADSALDANSTVVLNASAGFSNYQWNTGATTASFTATAVGTYWVKYSDICSWNVDTFHVSDPLSVDGLQHSGGLTVYPNPANEHLRVQLEGATGKLNVELKDVSGKRVLSKECQSGDWLPVNNITNGVYFLTVSDIEKQQRSLPVRVVIMH